MMDNSVISVKDVSKKYRLYDSPKHRLKEALHPFRKKYHHEFWALQDISFEIEKGETVGIIGRNGSGKSTLLQVVCGILQPTTGEISVNGRVSALLELGAGFNPEFTGRQNVYLNGALIGVDKEEMDNRFNTIASFADIGEFIDQPVKTYSSGMHVRLAFSVAIHVEPDILVVDEALSVGDMFFQAKCMAVMKSMAARGTTMLFVSHDANSVKSLCRRALLLDGGKVVANDQPDRVVEKYFALKIASEQRVINPAQGQTADSRTETRDLKLDDKGSRQMAFLNNAAFVKRASFQRIQNGKASFKNIQLLDEKGSVINSVEYDQYVTLRMSVEIHEDVHAISCGYHIQDKNGISIINSNMTIENKLIHFPKTDERYSIDWKFKASLMQGAYNILCVLSIPLQIDIGEVDFCDYIPCAYQFEMQRRKSARLYGYVHWDNCLEVTNLKE